MCDTCEGLVEGGRVTVVGQGDAHASRQQPSGEGEGLLVLQEPVPEALIVHLLSLEKNKHTSTSVSEGGQRKAGPKKRPHQPSHQSVLE